MQRHRTGPRARVQSARVKTKVWLESDGRFAIGDGGLRLLLGISTTGSLAAAVREIGWSYRHAWGYLRRAEQALGVRLIVARPGKGAARGTALTEQGRSLLERLVELRRRVDDAVGPSGPTPDEIAARGRPRRKR
jgi:molybdate transport system regulatory protein